MIPDSITPMPPYFIVKIGKELQKDKKEKIGSLYFPQEFTFLRRGCQFGEIVAIGSEAKECMPMANVGDYLLYHHFVEGKKTDNGYNFYLLGEDSEFNYYAINCFDTPGERGMAYAVAIGEEIIPTPDYVFLEVPKEDEFSEISENGIIKIERSKTREEWTAIMKENMNRIQQLSRNIPQSPIEEAVTLSNPERREKMEYAIKEIKNIEAINTKISKDINKKKYEPFKIAAINPDWNDQMKEMFGEHIQVGDIVYFLNIACHTKIDFSGTEFIVTESRYIGAPLNWLRKSLQSFNARHDSKYSDAAGKRKRDKVRS